ncbi:MAG: tRNA (adenosine(37)-N6)-dimethylallyltransferase MiaA, partial [Burkholderiales bacterium]|nr:tRNA (adenosine(37)-N6)-dimethylallyltransferase MiaA [Burkholderiales bacterium]
TMLYAKALLEGLSDLPEGDDAVRAALEARAALMGWPAMHTALAQVDPVTAARLKPTDAQRIQRALEVFALTGSKISALQTRATSAYDFPFNTLRIGLVAGERAALHQRIASRFDAMLTAVLVDEVRLLRARYVLNAALPSMRCVGYRQTWQYLEGEIDHDKLRETGVIATRQLAKRQLTWLRSMPDFLAVDCLRPDLQAAVVAQVTRFLDKH